MAVNSCEEDQDSYKIAVMPDQSTSVPPCETKVSFLNGLEVSLPLERSLSLNAVLSGQNKVKGNMANVDVDFSCIVVADLEKGRSEKPKTKTEPIRNGTIENPSKKTMQKQISIQMGEKIMQMLMDKNLVWPKFDFRDLLIPVYPAEVIAHTLSPTPTSYSNSNNNVAAMQPDEFTILSSSPLIDFHLEIPFEVQIYNKTVPERVHDMPNNRLRKYKRSASFNSRKVVLLFSVLSSLGTMILIFLTLRVRQLADGSLHE